MLEKVDSRPYKQYFNVTADPLECAGCTAVRPSPNGHNLICQPAILEADSKRTPQITDIAIKGIDTTYIPPDCPQDYQNLQGQSVEPVKSSAF